LLHDSPPTLPQYLRKIPDELLVVLRLLPELVGSKQGFAQEELPMKRSTARWTTAFAAAALIGVPAAGWSQTPPAPTSPRPAAQQPADAHGQHGAAAEEIRAAETALNDIPVSTLPARAKPRVAELKRHLNSLQKAANASTASSSSTSTATKPSAAPKNTWAKDVAAIDKILNELLGSAPAGTPSTATGTAGSTQPKASTPQTLDDTSRAKLMEIRDHVTKFAASMSGAPSTPGAAASSSSPSAESASAAAAQAPAANPAPSAESTPPAATASSAAAATPPSAATPSAAGEQAQAATAQAQTAQAPTAQSPSETAASAQIDEEAAKRYLTAARDSLAQLTQLPAAAQLSGEPRTQVSQLISNFNELITAKSDWRAAYDKVAANITALIGPEGAAPEAPATSAATPGAVGTSGNTAAALDPGIKGKLVEFRSHLKDFEKAAGAAPSGAPSAAPSAAPSEASSPMSSTSAAPSSASPSSASPSNPSSSSASPTSPSASPSPEPSASSNPGASSVAQQSSSKMNEDSPIAHIEAIEAMIGSGSKLTLEPAQVQQIRMHLAELRKAVDKK
jgi:hypothetical protein